MQELQTLVDTKANQVELEMINRDKIGSDEYHELQTRLNKFEHQVNYAIELNHENDSMAECLGQSLDETQTENDEGPKYRKNIYGFGDGYLKEMEDLQLEGRKVTQKDVLKYHQVQMNEMCKRMIENEIMTNNMKKEIITQREDMAKNQHVVDEVKRKQ